MLDLFGHIDEILREKVGLGVLARYYLSFVPLIFVLTAPIAMLLATLFVLSGMNRHNEITAMKACGASLLRITTPFLILGLIMSVLSFLVNDRLVPKGTLISMTIKETEIEKKSLPKKEKVLSDVTFYGTRNRLFYIKSYDVGDNLLNDIIILEHDKRNVVRSRIVADHARWEQDRWRFYNVAIYRQNGNGEVLGEPLIYKEKLIDIDERPEDFQRRQREPIFMSFRELRNYIVKFEEISPDALRGLAVDLHQKVAFPFANLVIILIGIPFALTKRIGGGILRGIGVSIAVSFLYYCLMFISCSLGKAGFLPPVVSAWMANLIFGATGIFLIRKV